MLKKPRLKVRFKTLSTNVILNFNLCSILCPTVKNGGLQNTSSVGTEGLQEKAGTAEDIIRRDLKDMDITWDEADELATDRAEWHQRVAQCTHLDDTG